VPKLLEHVMTFGVIGQSLLQIANHCHL